MKVPAVVEVSATKYILLGDWAGNEPRVDPVEVSWSGLNHFESTTLHHAGLICVLRKLLAMFHIIHRCLPLSIVDNCITSMNRVCLRLV